MPPNDFGAHGLDGAVLEYKVRSRPVSSVSVRPPAARRVALKILILEDEPHDAELMVRELRKAGLDCTARRVDTRADFIGAIESFAPDIVLADYKLPEFNGGEALAHVRHVHPEIPVVMVTGALGDEAAIELLKAGAKDYVLKGNLLRLPPAVERAIAVEQGIRDRKAAEAALRAANALLQTVERIAHIGGFDHNIADGAIVWSDETYRIHGLVPDEFVPTLSRFIELIHPDDLQRVEQAINASVTRDQPFDCEFRILRPDRTARIIHSQGEVVRDATGRPIRITGTSHDITEQKQAEEKIREDEAKFRSLVEQNVAGVVIIRKDGTVGYINPYFAGMIGWTQAEATGRRFIDFIPQTERSTVASHLRAHFSGEGGFVQVEVCDAGAGWRHTRHSCQRVANRLRGATCLARGRDRHHRAQAGRGCAAGERGQIP